MRKRRKWLLPFFTLLLLVVVIFVAFPPQPKSISIPLTTTVDPLRENIDDSNEAEIAGNFESLIDSTPYPELQDFLYENVASVNNAINPTVKYVYIIQGFRKEQVAERFAEVLEWSEAEKQKFISTDHPDGLANAEGYYYPGTYTVHAGENSESVSKKMFDRFEREIEERYASTTSKLVNIDTALKIASLIEREAAGKHDMRLISGIIWNRVFSGMNLEIDATLQYAKGSEENGWWPMVYSKDKYIDSPYNTYKYKGFPPTPIANPGVASVYAALNPQKTECLFYLHDKKRRIHCTKTYEAHKRNIALYY